MGWLKRRKRKDAFRVLRVPVDYIQINSGRVRKYLCPSSMRELTESIKRNGVLQPLILRYNEQGELELVSGYRRLKAAKDVGREEVPCLILPLSEQQAALLTFHDNRNREDWHYFEQAALEETIFLHSDFTQEEACKRMGRKQQEVRSRIRLLHLQPDQQDKIAKADLPEEYAQALLEVEDKCNFDKALHYIAAKKLNINASRLYIYQLNRQSMRFGGSGETVKNSLGQDVECIVNAINQAVSQIHQAGIAAKTEQINEEGCMKYIVEIPIEKQSSH